MKNLTKVFIDTNVWFSAFYESANAEKILKVRVDKKVQAIISQTILDELVRNISQKIPRSVEPLRIFLEATPLLIIKGRESIRPEVIKLAHPKDRIILQAEIDSRVKYFTTGNLKHFNSTAILKKFDLKILSPIQVVKLLKL